MSSRFAVVLGLGGALALGFTAGWFGRGAMPSTPTILPAGTALPVVVAAPSVAVPSVAAGAAPPATSESAVTDTTMAARAELLALLKEIGFPISIPVAHGDRVTMPFEKFFRLTPDEVARLNALISATRARGNALVAARASGGITPDGKKLIVDVPAFPDEGGAVYDEMLVGISQVLGPERFAHFDAVAGSQFESTFHQFGLQQVRYEVSLEPSATYAGTPHYSYRLYHADAEGLSPVSGGSASPIYLLLQLPFLERFLPPAFAQPPAK